MSRQLAIGYILGGLFFAGVFTCALCIGNTMQARSINVLCVFFGGTAGWLIGLLLSPAKNDVEDFERIGAAILTFVTGFGVAKFDQLFASATKDGELNELFLGRVLLVATAFCLGALYVFVGRRYWTNFNSTAVPTPGSVATLTPPLTE